MKREELIKQLELLPEGTEVFVYLKEKRIAEPHLCIYDTEPNGPTKLVAYIKTFSLELTEYMRPDHPLFDSVQESTTYPCHEYLHHVCHHGRDMFGTCISCSEEEGEFDEEEEDDNGPCS